jgi:ATP-binding protein involved in chromosome partitioning
MTATQQQPLLDRLSQVLQQMETQEIWPQNPELPLSKRVLEAIPSGKGWQVHVASDNLVLEQKRVIERALVEGASSISDQISVNFRPLHRVPRETKVPHPVAPHPFQMRMNRIPIPGVKEIIAVASGKGGVGKSTVCVNLAAALQEKGYKVGILDADIYGPSIPSLLGLTGPMAVAADDKLVPPSAYGIPCASFGFFSDGENPVMWRGPMIAKAFNQLCYDVAWGELDFLLIDLPPGTGDVQLTLVEKLPVDCAVIVTTAQDLALIDAHKALSMFQALQVPIAGVVENMALHHCSNCGHEEPLFTGHLDALLDTKRVTKLGQLPFDRTLLEHSVKGIPIAFEKTSPLYTTFQSICDRLLQRPTPLNV